jgi:(R,R)-butanediol dehydrogenase/meso-butanediol dehydrogenase/diacetyl reductase
MATHSALRFHGNQDLRLETIAQPVPKATEVKVKVEYCAVCATDVEEFVTGPHYIQAPGTTNKLTGAGIPMTVGHEVVGVVTDVGASVSTVKPGQRCVFCMYACGNCFYCKQGNVPQCDSWVVAGFMCDGGLAEYMVFDEVGVVPVASTIGERPGLALCEPTAVAVRAVKRSGLVAGETIAVLGAGAIGLLVAQVAKAAGCRVIIIDMRQLSLDLATKHGWCDAAVNGSTEDVSAAVRNLCEGSSARVPLDGPDVVFDCAAGKGGETANIAIGLARRGGRVVLVSVYGTPTKQVDFDAVVGTEKTIIGTLSMGRSDMEEAVRLMAAGEIDADPLVSGVIALSDVIGVGYKRMLSPSKDFFRIVVDPRLPNAKKPAGIEALAGLYEEEEGAEPEPEAPSAGASASVTSSTTLASTGTVAAAAAAAAAAPAAPAASATSASPAAL